MTEAVFWIFSHHEEIQEERSAGVFDLCFLISASKKWFFILIIFRNRIMLCMCLLAISSPALPRFSFTILRSQACSPEYLKVVRSKRYIQTESKSVYTLALNFKVCSCHLQKKIIKRTFNWMLHFTKNTSLTTRKSQQCQLNKRKSFEWKYS